MRVIWMCLYALKRCTPWTLTGCMAWGSVWMLTLGLGYLWAVYDGLQVIETRMREATQIAVYPVAHAQPQDVDAIEQRMKQLDHVQNVKALELQDVQTQLAAIHPELTSVLTTLNKAWIPPLILITPYPQTSWETIETLAQTVSRWPMVRDVDPGFAVDHPLRRTMQTTRRIGWTLIVVLITMGCFLVGVPLRWAMQQQHTTFTLLHRMGAPALFTWLPAMGTGALWGLWGGALGIISLMLLQHQRINLLENMLGPWFANAPILLLASGHGTVLLAGSITVGILSTAGCAREVVT